MLSNFGSKNSAFATRGEKGAKNLKGKVSKKKKDYDTAREKIAAHLDLTKPLEGIAGGKLFKNLE